MAAIELAVAVALAVFAGFAAGAFPPYRSAGQRQADRAENRQILRELFLGD